MPFSDPIVAGNTLIKDAIQSEGYVAGVSGWSIQRNGNAEFNSISIRGSWTIQGTAPNELAYIRAYLNVSSPAIEYGDPDGFRWQIRAGGGANARLNIEPTNGLAPTSSMYFLTNGGTVFRSSQVAGGASVIFDDVTGYFRVGTYAPLALEGYQNIVPLNGWTNSGGLLVPLRCLRLANGMVHVEGSIVPGTTANGTIIGQLPVGARPLGNRRQMGFAAAGWAGFIEIFTDGNMAIYGGAGPATVSFCGQFPVVL